MIVSSNGALEKENPAFAGAGRSLLLFEADFIADRFRQFFKHSLVSDQHGFDRVQILTDGSEFSPCFSEVMDELRLRLNQQRHRSR